MIKRASTTASTPAYFHFLISFRLTRFIACRLRRIFASVFHVTIHDTSQLYRAIFVSFELDFPLDIFTIRRSRRTRRATVRLHTASVPKARNSPSLAVAFRATAKLRRGRRLRL